MTKIRPIAIYLPQFHPTPENDEWWGKGFTEWTNVTKAKALFKGHNQPQLPSDLGFYDLRLEESRLAQEAMAKEYGIYGFCYYHYWFNGKRILNEPIDRKLKNLKEDLPFLLCWANETWSRRWLGEEKNILIKQEYSKQDDINHAEYLASVFIDERYVKIESRPIFVIYRPYDLPDPSSTVKIIKEVFQLKHKIEPFIVANISKGNAADLKEYGFDSVLNFRPSLGSLPNSFDDGFSYKKLFRNILKNKLFDGTLKIYDYKMAIEAMKTHEQNTIDNTIPCVFVGWDNTARRGKEGIIIHNSSANVFEAELSRVKKQIINQEYSLNLIFLNAWNEWAEGNALEPNTRTGFQFLESVKKIFKDE